MPSPHHPAQNHLLAALPAKDYERLLPHLELSPLPLGWTVYDPGCKQGNVYFPTNAIVSLLYVTKGGASAEVATVGNDGLIGIAGLIGGDTTPSHAIVQCAGFGYRLKTSHLKAEFERGGEVQHLLLRYTQALITQTGQTAACNRHHSIDQRLCRSLLSSMDRLPSNELKMTQERIAHMLGVRREGITDAARKLQKAGLINYSRGRITVLDRQGLKERVCECYAVVKKEMNRLLPLH